MDPSPDALTTGADGRRGKPRRAVGVVVITLLGFMGVGLLVASFLVPVPRPPQPTAAVAPKNLHEGRQPADVVRKPLAPAVARAHQTPTSPRAGMARSVPTHITIPAIGVNAGLLSLGTDKNGSIAVPPRDKAMLAGWYEYGPTPGEVGNSVIVGHVDSSVIGPAVFFKLGALKPGDDIQVSRKDGRVVHFTVDGVKSYPKAEFPTELVYGPSDQVSLRLVTCGGTYSKQTSYPDNVIVFATRTSTAPPSSAKSGS